MLIFCYPPQSSSLLKATSTNIDPPTASHPPYSLNLVPDNFCLLPKLKQEIAGAKSLTQKDRVKTVIAKAHDIGNSVLENVFLK